MENLRRSKIAIIGLGYVGLPLAIEFAKKYKVLGFDVDKERVITLRNHIDRTEEVTQEELKKAKSLTYTYNKEDLADPIIYIITVPTPIDNYKKPDLSSLKKASYTLGKYLKKGNIVIYESTVYPGCTEEVCVPELEKASGLTFNKDFYCGYSPERINPGDKTHRIHNIVKVTSGSTPEIAEIVDKLYKSIVEAGTHKASSIKVAEAAKVIENAQRDINIAFVNELAMVFNKLEIDTHSVLAAAATKWNFLPFQPGLVGGHCIGVDPYYLAQKAQEIGHHPEIILSGRRVNDSMGEYVATELLKLMISNDIPIKGSKVLILGISFKENCPDTRNTKVIDVYKTLKSYSVDIDVYDPWADVKEVKKEYQISIIPSVTHKTYDAIIHAVAHKEFLELDLEKLKNEKAVVYDVKGTLISGKVDKRL